jgi:hypothetical protein
MAKFEQQVGNTFLYVEKNRQYTLEQLSIEPNTVIFLPSSTRAGYIRRVHFLDPTQFNHSPGDSYLPCHVSSPYAPSLKSDEVEALTQHLEWFPKWRVFSWQQVQELPDMNIRLHESVTKPELQRLQPQSVLAAIASFLTQSGW